MTNRSMRRDLGLALLLLSATSWPGLAQEYSAPRTADGKPDLNGMWQAVGSMHWDIEPHAASPGPVPEMGAVGAIPGGLGVVEGGAIPYQPWAAEKQEENQANWLALDPLVKCYRPGVPRAAYLPFPFLIVQEPEHIVMAYEFGQVERIVYMSRPDYEAPIESWMGHSRGHWEGETLVIDVTAQLPDTWFDHAGNFHSDQLHVVERYTAMGPNHLLYEATIEDPGVLTRPFTIRLPLYRRVEENAQLIEFKCMEFTEKLLYGHLEKAETAP